MNQSQLRVFVIQAADEYLAYEPQHSFGFCWYATGYITQELKISRDRVGAGVYDMISDIMYALGYVGGYVGNQCGCTPLRLQFVADLRAFLINDQD